MGKGNRKQLPYMATIEDIIRCAREIPLLERAGDSVRLHRTKVALRSMFDEMRQEQRRKAHKILSDFVKAEGININMNRYPRD
jgi:hypothetical protein